MLFFPILHKPSCKPTDVVVLPSPAGVGEIAVTKINFEFFCGSLLIASISILAI